MIQATLDMLTMKAFRADIRDHRIPFGNRDIDENLLGIDAWRTGVSLCNLQLKESPGVILSSTQEFDGLHDDELKEEITNRARSHYMRYAIGLLSHGFTIELREGLGDSLESESEVIRREPAAILGGGIESQSRYSLVRHPSDPSQALVITYAHSAIARLEGFAKGTPITFLQIAGGVELALSSWLETTAAHGWQSQPIDLVLWDAPTVTIVQVNESGFTPNIFCRTDGSGIPPAESSIVLSGLKRYLRSGSRVVLLDLSLERSKEGSFGELLSEMLGDEDLTIGDVRHPFELLLTEGRP